MDIKNFYFVLSLISGIGLKSFHKKISTFGSYEAFWNSLEKTPLSVRGQTFFQRDLLKLRDENWTRMSSLGIQFVSYKDSHFPVSLLKIKDPPLGLYVKGSLSCFNNPLFAIVGTRYPTLYGRRMTENLTLELSSSVTIVSGLALGVDQYAHRVALQSSFSTIAVLGSGLGEIYPSSHRPLAQKIIDSGGLLVSEYPIDMKAMGCLFPRRNRLISALSTQGVLIVEGALKSGSMVTARYAIDHKHKLYAVPGSVGVKQSEGPLALLAEQKARLVRFSEDIDLHFQDKAFLQQSPSKSCEPPDTLPFLNEDLKSVFEVLGKNVLYFDEIVTVVSGMRPHRLLTLLSQLEGKGLCEKLADGRWRKKEKNHYVS